MTEDLTVAQEGETDIATAGAAPHYWAFIAYSHRDERVAAELQRAIETFPLPRKLVGRRTAAGAVPKFVRPLFRDRNEMPAGADLSREVRAALAASRWLIVVCSPNAAASDWVNREVLEFTRLHGALRVLAVIVAGEPHPGDGPAAASECFPPALRGPPRSEARADAAPIEPAAADLRPGGDGRRMAVIKLVSGMAGVAVDELARRDAQRRTRRLAWVALASTVGMVAMAGLTALALQARGEAQRQRAQAESLVEFMLGDLHQRLTQVGRLDLLDAIATRVLRHYTATTGTPLNADELGRRARALQLIGEIREQRGDLAGADTAFRQAAAATADVLALAPNDPRRIFDHAQSMYWVGYVAWSRHLTMQSEGAFREYLALARRLVHIDRTNPAWQLEVAYAAQNLGNLLLDDGRNNEALAVFRDNRDALLQIAAMHKDAVIELANAHGWIAKAQERLGAYQEAIAEQRAKIELLARRSGSGHDPAAQQLSANGYHELAHLHLTLGDAGAAVALANKSVAMFDALVALDGTNLDWLGQACIARLTLAETLQSLLRFTDAGTVLTRVATDALAFPSQGAAASRRQLRLRGGLLTQQARLALARDAQAPPEPLIHYIDEVQRVERAGLALDPEQRHVVAAARLALGDLLARDGRSTAADYWRAIIHTDEARTDSDWQNTITLARAHLRVGNWKAARALAAKVQRADTHSPAYLKLLHELRAPSPRLKRPYA